MLFAPNDSATPSMNFSCRGVVYDKANDHQCEKVLHLAAIVLLKGYAVRSSETRPNAPCYARAALRWPGLGGLRPRNAITFFRSAQTSGLACGLRRRYAG